MMDGWMGLLTFGLLTEKGLQGMYLGARVCWFGKIVLLLMNNKPQYTRGKSAKKEKKQKGRGGMGTSNPSSQRESTPTLYLKVHKVPSEVRAGTCHYQLGSEVSKVPPGRYGVIRVKQGMTENLVDGQAGQGLGLGYPSTEVQDTDGDEIRDCYE